MFLWQLLADLKYFLFIHQPFGTSVALGTCLLSFADVSASSLTRGDPAFPLPTVLSYAAAAQALEDNPEVYEAYRRAHNAGPVLRALRDAGVIPQER